MDYIENGATGLSVRNKLNNQLGININVLDYGCVGDGVTNDSTNFQAAIDAAILAGKPLFVPKGKFLVTALTVNGALVIFGDGNESVIYTESNNTIFNVTAAGFRCFDLKIEGNDVGTSEIGIKLNTVNNYVIDSCEFYNLGGIGVNCAGIVITNSVPSKISNSYFSTCRIGIKIDQRHEYVSMTNNVVWACDYAGYWITGGNFTITGGSITKNGIGIYMTAGINDSHSSISNVLINHNTQIIVNGITFGLVFSSCQFWSNNTISFISTKDILLNGCEFGVNTWNFNASITHFANCIDGGSNTYNNDSGGNASKTLWTGLITIDETDKPFRIQAEKDDGIALLMKNKTGTENYRLNANGSRIIKQFSAALTDGAPTDSEIDAATGLTPATAGAGYQCTILDSDGTGLLYRIESDGTNWQYLAMNKAL